MRKTLLLCLGVMSLLIAPALGRAEQADDERQIVKTLRTEIEEMETRHRAEMSALRDRLEELEERLTVAESARQCPEGPSRIEQSAQPCPAAPRSIEQMPEQSPTQITAPVAGHSPAPPLGQLSTTRGSQGLNVFNPRITAFGNFVGRVDDKRVENEDGDSIGDRFNLREVELDFRAAIDPWADGVIIVALESEVPGDYETSVEEGYVTLKKLPLLDGAPLGLKLKAGRFRPTFGRFNKIHTHDLPQITRPLSLQTFLGEEGFIGDGLSGEFFVPTPGDANSLTATLATFNDGELPMSGDEEGDDPAYLAHLAWFWDLAAGHDLEVGSTVYLGSAGEEDDLDAELYGVDLTYKWKPFGRGEWRSFIFGGELFSADVDMSDGNAVSALGYYTWLQYQLDRNLYLGGRYDFTEEIADEQLESEALGVFLTYYTSEFLRLRLGYEHTESDLDERDGLDTGWLEVNFVFGSHPVEPYWVNR